MTVNITCTDCDGRRLCEACRNAARSLTEAGFLVEHSTRYAALRAAAAGTYGFEACVVPVAANERAIAEAATILMRGKRLAFVAEEVGGWLEDLAHGATVVERKRFLAGDVPLTWLTGPPPVARNKTSDETATVFAGPPLQVADGARATRRLKSIADSTRATVARAGLSSAPRLDMMAVLEDEAAWARISGVGFGMVLIHLPGIAAAKPGESLDRVETRLTSAAATISRALRSTDVVAVRGDDFVAVLAEAGEAGTRLAAARISAAIAASPLGAGVKPRRGRGFAAWSIGRATFPADGAGRDALLARATATLEPISERR